MEVISDRNVVASASIRRMTPSTPSRVAFSSAQNPLKSITPGYRETDVKLLTEEVVRPILSPTPSSEDEERGLFTPDDGWRYRDLYCQISLSYAVFTL